MNTRKKKLKRRNGHQLSYYHNLIYHFLVQYRTNQTLPILTTTKITMRGNYHSEKNQILEIPENPAIPQINYHHVHRLITIHYHHHTKINIVEHSLNQHRDTDINMLSNHINQLIGYQEIKHLQNLINHYYQIIHLLQLTVFLLQNMEKLKQN